MVCQTDTTTDIQTAAQEGAGEVQVRSSMWCCSREGHEDVTDEQLGTCSTLGAHDGSGDGAVAWIHRLLGCLWYFEGEMVAGESK